MAKDLCTEYTVLPGHERNAELILQEFATYMRSDPSALMFLPFAVQASPPRFLVLERYINEHACHAQLVSHERRSFVERLSRHTEAKTAALTWLQSLA